MKPAKIIVLSAVLLGLALGTQAHAETAAVLPISGINVSDGTLEAAQDVLRGKLAMTGRYRVVVLAGPVGRDEPSGESAVAQARAAGADLAVVVHITRLGANAQVRLAAYATGGPGYFVDEMSAASPEDLDRVLERLARALASGRSSKETASLDTVTEKEASPVLKRAASHVFGLGLGTVVPFGAADAIPGASVFWLYDARSYLADVTLQFHAKDGRGDASVGIGLYYPLSESDLAPYVGGGVRYAHTDYLDGPGASGLQLYAALGVLQGRLGAVQLRGQLEFFVDTYSQSTYDYGYYTTAPSPSSTTTMVGNGLAFSLGIGF